MSHSVSEADRFEGGFDMRLSVRFAQVRQKQRQFNILEGSQYGNEIIKLKYQSNMTRSPGGNFAFVHGGDFFATDRHASGSRLINSGDQIQQCRLAGARWPHDRHERFARNVEGHIIQRAHLEFIALVGTSHMRQLHCAVSIIVFRLCHKSFLTFRITALLNTSAQTSVPLWRCLRGNGQPATCQSVFRGLTFMLSDVSWVSVSISKMQSTTTGAPTGKLCTP